MTGTRTTPPRRRRRFQRGAHLVTGVPVLAYVYTAPAADAPLTLGVRWVAVPVLVATGLAMWLAPRLRRRRAVRSRAS